jgi:hypothetical protein
VKFAVKNALVTTHRKQHFKTLISVFKSNIFVTSSAVEMQKLFSTALELTIGITNKRQKIPIKN